jgi:hypothetical protein
MVCNFNFKWQPLKLDISYHGLHQNDRPPLPEHMYNDTPENEIEAEADAAEP